MKNRRMQMMVLLAGFLFFFGFADVSAQDAPYVGAWEADTFFENITSEEMDELRTKKILFASRSFGLNMHNGLTSLKNSNPMHDLVSDYVRYDVFSAGGDLSIMPADVYDNYNFLHFLATPSPNNQRLTEFDTVIRDAPHSFHEDIDVAVVYYHTADAPVYPDYTNTMHQLQADYPNIKFIYVTSGLMDTNHASYNAKSAAFSSLIRENEKDHVPVYDLHYILNNDDTCGLGYCPEYSTDPAGVHPNTDFAQRRMGKAFLLILRDAFFGSACTSAVPASVPAGLAGSALPDNSISLSWNESTHPDCFIHRYEVRRDGSLTGSTHGTNYTDTGLAESTAYDYAVRSVTMGGVESAYSSTTTVTTLADTTPPTLEEIEVLSSTQITAEFSEELDPATAQTASNYALDNGGTVLSASLSVDTVTLAIGELSDGTTYTLTVNSVKDASAAGNAIAPNSQITFDYQSAPYPEDPDGYWAFNGDLTDAVNANDGTWVNGSSFGTGLLQEGLSLDGSLPATGSYVSIPHKHTLDGMSNLSISVWAKKDASGVGGKLFKKHVVYDFAISTAGISGYLFNEFGSRADVSSSAPINDTNWHHYCLVYNGSRFLAYVDGTERGSTPLSAKVASNANDINAGADPWGNTFAGEMDEMKLFRRALSTNEISALVTAGLTGAADRVAVRDLLDTNGLTSKTVNGVSVTKNDRISELYIQEGGTTNITSRIGQLSELVLLHCYGDRTLGHPLLTTVAPELGNCVKLEELLLSQNDLADLPAAIVTLTALKIMSIGDNYLCDGSPVWESWADTYDPDWRVTQDCSGGGNTYTATSLPADGYVASGGNTDPGDLGRVLNENASILVFQKPQLNGEPITDATLSLRELVVTPGGSVDLTALASSSTVPTLTHDMFTASATTIETGMANWDQTSTDWQYHDVETSAAGDAALAGYLATVPDGHYILLRLKLQNQMSGYYFVALNGHTEAAPLLTITTGNAPDNQPPTVEAGADQAITLPNSAALNGSVDIDGLPSGTLTQLWSKQSGPGTVSFTDPAALQTSAAFSEAGTYVLELEASDSELSGSDTVTITVHPESGGNTYTATSLPADGYVASGGNTDPGDLGRVLNENASILVFQKPQLNGEPITDATLSLRELVVTPGGSVDLTALASSSTVPTLTHDMFTASATTIETGMANWDQTSTDWQYHDVETSAAGDAALAGYLATVPDGHYILLRLKLQNQMSGYYFVALNGHTEAAPLLTITTGNAPDNQPPTVEAGADQAVTLPNSAALNGSADTDDLLGDVRIYSRALSTPEEVLLAQEIPPKPPAPVVALGSASFGTGADVISWNPVQGSGFVYSVWYSTNLMEGFQPLETNLADTVLSVTNTINAQSVFYEIEAQ